MNDSATAGRPVRLRFAPSPTGDLHVGGARAALYTWLFARQQNGVFILRIEDTDRRRYDEESIQSITGSLDWLGLDIDEGPIFQSERLPIYQEQARWLVEHGHAYECFCSPERLAGLREEQIRRKQPPGYDRHCRDLTAAQRDARRAEGITPVIRLKVPLEGVTVCHDLLRGEISYENRVLEDAVLLKSDGYPTYHLAAMVDDHQMEISHVTRGEEWIPSFPLHVLIYRAFGWDLPIFVHMPVILKPDGKGKLSKRDGAASVFAYRDGGYLPEAVINYIALVGWSYNDRDEIFSLNELVEKFSFERVSPSPARFNFDKLNWMNQYYINHILDVDDLTQRVLPLLRAAGLVGEAKAGSTEYALARDAVALVKDKLKLLTEAPELTSFFFVEPEEYPAELLIPRKTEPAAVLTALERSRAVITELGVADEEQLETALRELGDELGLKAGQLFMPIRVAVTGRTASPGLFETLRVIGQERSHARLDVAVEKLRAAELGAAAD